MLNASIIRTHCRVCGDRAAGFNYNEFTCDSCKVFFMRHHLRRNRITAPKCKQDGKCAITPTSRNCAACRLAKCHLLGMRKQRNKKEGENGLEDSKNQNKKPDNKPFFDTLLEHHFKELSKDDEVISESSRKEVISLPGKLFSPQPISIFELTPLETDQIESIRTAMSSAFTVDETRARIVGTARHLYDAFNLPEVYFRWTSEFCSSTPPFKALSHGDQLTLFKAYCFDLTAIRIAFLTLPERDGSLLLVNAQREEAIFVGHDVFRQATSRLDYAKRYIRFWLSLHRALDRDETVRDLLSTQMMFKPRDGISRPDFLHYHYVRYGRLLWRYLVVRHGNIPRAERRFRSLVDLVAVQADQIKHLERVMLEEQTNAAAANKDQKGGNSPKEAMEQTIRPLPESTQHHHQVSHLIQEMYSLT